MPDDSFLAGRATEKVPLDASVLSTVHVGPHPVPNSISQPCLTDYFGHGDFIYMTQPHISIQGLVFALDGASGYNYGSTQLATRTMKKTRISWRGSLRCLVPTT